jgi:purine-binding chemotaxis protein CheW
MAGRAAELRREFDRSFAVAPITELARFDNMLAVRIGGDAYAIRLTEVGGLYADRRIVPLPTPVPSLLGMAGFRGQLAPVYDLAALLGYTARSGAGIPRWLVLARGRDVVALAFDAFEAQLVVPPERVMTSGVDARPHLRDAVQADDGLRPIVDLSSVLVDIHKRVETTHMKKER